MFTLQDRQRSNSIFCQQNIYCDCCCLLLEVKRATVPGGWEAKGNDFSDGNQGDFRVIEFLESNQSQHLVLR